MWKQTKNYATILPYFAQNGKITDIIIKNHLGGTT